MLAVGIETLAIAEWTSQLGRHPLPGYGSGFALLIPFTLLWRRAHPFRAMVSALLVFSLVEATGGILNWTTVPVTLMLLSFAVGTGASTPRRVVASALFRAPARRPGQRWGRRSSWRLRCCSGGCLRSGR